MTLVPTFVVVAVDATGMGIILPLLPFYSQRLGATPFLIGALISVYAVCQLIAGPVVGILSDRYGRRKVLVVSQVGTLIGFVLLALAGNLTLVFLARIIDGLTSGNISVAHAYAAEHSAPETRKQALGMTSGAIGTGLLLGPALSSFLVHYGQTAPVWAAAALSLISILATIALLPPDHPASEPLYQHRVPEPTLVRSLFGMRYAWRLLGLLIVFFFVNSMFLSQIGLFLSARFSWDGHPFGARELGWMFAYAGFINMVVQGTPDHPGEPRSRPTARSSWRPSLAWASDLSGLSAGSNISLLALYLTLIIVGTMFARSTLTAELSRWTAINRQGMIMGLNQSLMSGANISAPLLSGALIGHRLFVPWALAMAAIAAIGAALAGQLARRSRETPASAARPHSSRR